MRKRVAGIKVTPPYHTIHGTGIPQTTGIYILHERHTYLKNVGRRARFLLHVLHHAVAELLVIDINHGRRV